MPDCNDSTVGAGLCDKHYRRFRRTGDPATIRPPRPSDASLRLTAEEDGTGLRTCKACGETKQLTDFPFREKARNYRDPNCQLCRNTRQAAASERRKALNPEKVRREARATHLRNKYGLTLEAYDARVEAQGRRCAACGTPTEQLLVDHNHVTGVVRELLCNGCNCSLGHAGDSIERLRQLVAYLERHATPDQVAA
jgi:hypothetical protein